MAFKGKGGDLVSWVEGREGGDTIRGKREDLTLELSDLKQPNE